MELVLLCGGPSKERDISLNSVRSVFDHLRTVPNMKIQVVFIDGKLNKYYIDEKFLYSNTASDFEFMLSNDERISEKSFKEILTQCDIVFPVMHGTYGEDGQIQEFLENNGIPFVASPSEACRRMYNKKTADIEVLRANSLNTIPKLFLSNGDNCESMVTDFMQTYSLDEAVIKPTEGGSSIGVTIASSVKEAVELASLSLQTYSDIVLEQLCRGREFTIIVLEANNTVVALMPTEIELLDKLGDTVSGEVFDKRKKYLSTNETRYYCPARFSSEKIDEIRKTAENLFVFIGAKDFLRIDGWLLDDGRIYFSDFNPISGMEQNSFIFQQAAAVNLRHRDLLELILQNACKRNNIQYYKAVDNIGSKKRINLLLGGITSERQVSLMSGTNVWLKLLNSEYYYPVPYILFSENGDFAVSEIPYVAALKHTTEEIYEYLYGRSDEYISYTEELRNIIINRLGLTEVGGVRMADTRKMTLDEFISITKEQNAEVFIGLHGGFGENGELQSLLENAKIRFNGSGSETSRLCMDKYLTGKRVEELQIPNVRTCRKVLVSNSDITEIYDNTVSYWTDLCNNLGSDAVVVKPNGDGCSTGIVVLHSADELRTYLELLLQKNPFIPENTFSNQPEKIQLPMEHADLLFEEYIRTEKLIITDRLVTVGEESNWIEMTVGVIAKQNCYHSLNPSITVADNAVLSLEEKFQGGTGINITPPPENIINAELLKNIKLAMEKVAEGCGIKDYCRIDIFADRVTNEIIVIEVNTLPGLSPSTVLFQQGAKETNPLYPKELLELIVS